MFSGDNNVQVGLNYLFVAGKSISESSARARLVIHYPYDLDTKAYVYNQVFNEYHYFVGLF